MTVTNEIITMYAEPFVAAETGASIERSPLTDAEVRARFADMVEQIDNSFTVEQERKLARSPVAKVSGTEEEFGMWGDFKPTEPAPAPE